MTLHVGLVGTGHWSEVHLAALQQSRHVGRVTLCGRSSARRTDLAGMFSKVAATVAEPEQLYRDPSIDVIEIVLPHDLHAPTALAALAAGKHVICEKPAALTLEQFDQVCAAASQAGRRFLVVMNQLYNPRFEAVRKLVADGLVGRPFLLIENAYSDHSQWYHNPAAWRTRVARAGGGVLIDGGFHMVYKHLELLRPFGAARWVQGSVGQLNLSETGAPRPELGEDFAQFVIGFDQPLRVGASHAWSLPAASHRRWEGFLAGTAGVLDFSSGMDGPVTFRPARFSSGEKEKELALPAVPEQPRHESVRNCLADYLAALVEDRPTRWGDGGTARTTLAVILSVYQSGRSGQRVMLTR